MSKHQTPLNWYTGGGSDTNTAVSTTPGRWALLIGIDRYPNLDPEWQLNGCVNDVFIMQDVLVRRFEFCASNVMTLVNEQATREGILAAMEVLLLQAGEGDIVVCYYSGHGSQIPADLGHKPSGLEKTLVPYDSGRCPYPNRDITDDEIYFWLLRLAAMMPLVTLILDCCQSGTIIRQEASSVNGVRSIPADDRPSGSEATRIPPESFELLRGTEDLPKASRRQVQKSVVSIVACGSNEPANEIFVHNQRSAYGGLTYFLVQVLMSLGLSGATWREVFESMAPQVSAHFGNQHPELHGAQDREVFGVREIQPMKYVPVESCEHDVIVLGAGKACGLTEGSRWVVYAPATRSVEDEEKYVGQVEVFETGVTSSKARAMEEEEGREEERTEPREPIRAGMRAVESARSLPGVRLAVEIAAPPSHAAAKQLAERVARSRFLWETSPGDSASGGRADIRIYLLGPRSYCGPEDPAPMLGPIPEETWVSVGLDGFLVAPAFSCRHPEAVESVVGNLENVARLRGVAGIRNDGSPLQKQVDFLVHRLEGRRCVAPTSKVDGEPVFFDGDSLVLEVRNHSRNPLYVYILDIGLTGKVTPIFPVLGAHEVLHRGHVAWVGLRKGEDLQFFIPQEFNMLCRAQEGAPVEGRETLKLFATRSPANFSLLFQSPMRFPRAVEWALNDIPNATVHGSYGNLRTAEDWVTIDRTFRLRSRNAAQAVA